MERTIVHCTVLYCTEIGQKPDIILHSTFLNEKAFNNEV